MTEIHINDIEEIKTVELDDRGRLTLGTEHANSKAKIVVVEYGDGGDADV